MAARASSLIACLLLGSALSFDGSPPPAPAEGPAPAPEGALDVFAQSSPLGRARAHALQELLVSARADEVGEAAQDANPKTAQEALLMLAGRQGLANPFVLMQGQGDDTLGMTLDAADSSLRAQLGLPEGQGVVVVSVVPGGPAEQAGLKPNDILLTLAGQPIDQPEDLTKHLKAAGEKPQTLTLVRGGQKQEIQVKPVYRVTLAPAESAQPSYYLGVSAQPVDVVLRTHLGDAIPQDQGLTVKQVVPGSPAEKAKIEPGDILLEIDGKPLKDIESLQAAVKEIGGKKASLSLLRAGKPVELAVTPEPRPEQEQASSDAGQGLYRFWTLPSGAGQALRFYSPAQVPNQMVWSSAIPRLTNQISSQASAPSTRADLEKQVKALNQQVEELRKLVDELKAQQRGSGSRGR